MSDELFSVKMKELRESTGLNRKEFCEKFEIPYRTMTEWELGHRNAPPYVLRLLSYYVRCSVSSMRMASVRSNKGDGYG
jgi:DNA-binding transcriptional regulator YiaG